MAENTIKNFAKTFGKSVKEVAALMVSAGLADKTAEDVISEKEKGKLLEYLRGKSADAPVVRRKKVVTRQVKGKTTAKGGTVNVEVRKKRSYPKKEVVEKQAAEIKPVAEETPEPIQSEVKDEKAEKTPAASPPESTSNEPIPKVIGAAEAEKPAAHRKYREKQPAETVIKDSVAGHGKKGKRRELHVTKEKRGKLKIKSKRIDRKNIRQADRRHTFEMPTEPVKREVKIYDNITVKELARGMVIKSAELIKQMFDMGMMATINQTLDRDTAVLVVEEMGHVAKIIKDESPEDVLVRQEREPTELEPRAAVVTVMGHVDHGKTSLLDYIRKSQVAEGEKGGITQHIGAYRVKTPKGEITFLDTPGHEAFTAMRARGAKLTDIVVLIVAADDGVMAQTEEAIQHAQLAKAPLIVAINKIDKPDSDIEKIKNDLAQKNVVPEQWGGDAIFVEISAKTGQGIEDLLEAILLQAEVLELKAAAKGPATGVVIESALDKGRGTVATILVEQGCLNKGDILIAGKEYGRVRSLFNEDFQLLESARASTPALVLGLSGVPEVGEAAVVVDSERQAKKITELRQRKDREAKLASQSPVISGTSFLSSGQEQEESVLKVLLKADVQGSAGALKDALTALSNDEVKAEIVAMGIGAITESDINLAATAKAIVIGFNVRADARARNALRSVEEVSVRYYSIIYEVIDDIKQMMQGMLSPEIREEIIGTAEVKEVFRSSKFGAVAGCQVVEGTIKRGRPIRVLRDNVVIYEGELESLRRHKDEVDKVIAGTECGIAVKDYNDVKVKDSIEVYERTEIQRTLED